MLFYSSRERYFICCKAQWVLSTRKTASHTLQPYVLEMTGYLGADWRVTAVGTMLRSTLQLLLPFLAFLRQFLLFEIVGIWVLICSVAVELKSKVKCLFWHRLPFTSRSLWQVASRYRSYPDWECSLVTSRFAMSHYVFVYRTIFAGPAPFSVVCPAEPRCAQSIVSCIFMHVTFDHAITR